MSNIERLSGIDAAFLYLETPTQHMHLCGTMILEPGAEADRMPEGLVPSGHGPSGGLADLLTRRIAELPAFRRTVVDTPLRISHPATFEAPSFEASDHVQRLTVPEPGGTDELAAIVGRIAARPLDRRRPLWELWILEGLERGRIGLVLKIHHALCDGVTALDVLGRLFRNDELPKPEQPRPEASVPNALELALSAVESVARVPIKVVSTLRRTGSALVSLTRSSVGTITSREKPAMLFSSPRTVLNHALSAERAVAFGQVPLETVKRIKNAFGVTVNDIILAACTRALGQYLTASGETLVGPLVATVPVSEHGSGIATRSANQVSAMFLGLPVHLADLDVIVRSIHEQSVGAKKMHSVFGPAMLSDWADIAPPRLFAAAAGAYSRWKLAELLPPPHSVVISNVPGPTESLYAGSARLVAAYPLGPILEGAAVNISVVSYRGAVDIGLVTCPRVVPRPDEITRGFENAIEELTQAAEDR